MKRVLVSLARMTCSALAVLAATLCVSCRGPEPLRPAAYERCTTVAECSGAPAAVQCVPIGITLGDGGHATTGICSPICMAQSPSVVANNSRAFATGSVCVGIDSNGEFDASALGTTAAVRLLVCGGRTEADAQGFGFDCVEDAYGAETIFVVRPRF